MRALKEGSVEILIGVDFSGASEPLGGAVLAAFSHFVRKVQSRYGHSPLKILSRVREGLEEAFAIEALKGGCSVDVLATTDSEASQAVARLRAALAEAGDRVHRVSPLSIAPDLFICRYAHILVCAATAANLSPPSILSEWRKSDRRWGDEQPGDDAQQIVVPPTIGPVIEFDLTKAAATAPHGNKLARLYAEVADAAEFSLFPKQPGALSELNALNRDLQRPSDAMAMAKAGDLMHPSYLQEIQASLLAQGASAEEADAVSNDVSSLRATFGRGDAFAIGSKNRILNPSLLFVTLALPGSVMAYEFFSHDSVGLRPVGLLIYMVILALVISIGGGLHIFRRQARQEDARLFSELIRVQIWWRVAGVGSRIESTMRRWIPNTLLGVQLAARSLDYRVALAPPVSKDLTPIVHKWWVGPSLAPNDKAPPALRYTQTVWYRDNSRIQQENADRVGMLQNAAFVVALLLAGSALTTHLLVGSSGEPWWAALTSLGISVVPAVAGACSLYSNRNGFMFFAQNYSQMARTSARASERLATLTDTGHRRQLIEQFGREVVGEGIDWLVARRQRRITIA